MTSEECLCARGCRLGCFPAVSEAITALSWEDPTLVTLHQLCYAHPGTKQKRKASVRNFSGVCSCELVALLRRVDKLTVKQLKDVGVLLDCLPKSPSVAMMMKSKDLLTSAIVSFLANPQLRAPTQLPTLQCTLALARAHTFETCSKLQQGRISFPQKKRARSDSVGEGHKGSPSPSPKLPKAPPLSEEALQRSLAEFQYDTESVSRLSSECLEESDQSSTTLDAAGAGGGGGTPTLKSGDHTAAVEVIDIDAEVETYITETLESCPPPATLPTTKPLRKGKFPVALLSAFAEVTTITITHPNPPYACALHTLCSEFLRGLDLEPFLCHDRDQCFCPHCYDPSLPDVEVIGGQRCVIPRNWFRFGVEVLRGKASANQVWALWNVAFHGTSVASLRETLMHGQIVIPGDRLLDGSKLAVRRGHITGRNSFFTSPTMKYCELDLYASPATWAPATTATAAGVEVEQYEVKVALEVRQKPGTFTRQRESVMAQRDLCKHICNEQMEWVTDNRAAVMVTGILVHLRRKLK